MGGTGMAKLAATLLLAAAAFPACALELHVAVDGNDANDGSAGAPFASLERARDAIRALKTGAGLPEGGVVVRVHQGVYHRQGTFALAAEDGGTAAAPVVYRGDGPEGGETRLLGGVRLTESSFKPVTDPAILERLDEAARGQVVQADLREMGITDPGKYPIRFRGAAAVPEVFFQNRRMQIARWPNEDWTTVEKVIERGARPRDRGSNVAVGAAPTTPGQDSNWDRPGTIQYQGDRPGRWNVERGVWLNGYWCYDWYDEALKVKSIDLEKRHITFEIAHFYGIGGGNPGPRRFYAFNLLEELDQPGEYYLDPDTLILYFWPPAPLGEEGVLVSTLGEPLVSLRDVSHVTLRGLILEACQGTALTVDDGREVRIQACTVRNTGTTGITVNGGERHLVEGCDIHDTGTLGLVLTGGDRPTLTPAGHEARNNHIYRFGRRQRTYASGIQLGGVGNRLAHNLLHDAPHQAIGMAGNDHIVEFNEVHHVIMETDDCGALYTGRNPSNRGSIIRYNFWHHLGTPLGHGNAAIYFDDGDGGQTVFGNVFLRTGQPSYSNFGAVFNHGGHGNWIDNNVFVECRRAVGASPWGESRWISMLKGDLWQTRLLKEVDITKPPFTERYPELVGYFEPEGKPRVNLARRNVVAMCGEVAKGNYVEENNWVTGEDPGFVDAAAGNFALREDAPVFREIPGFEPIPFARIGLYRDELRPSLPAREWSYAPPAQAAAPDVRPPRPAPPPPATLEAKTGPAPVFRVPRAAATVTVDGTIAPAEWDGAKPEQAMSLAQRHTGEPANPVSQAWLRHDGENLWLAVDNAMDPAKPMRIGRQWGQDEAVELAVRNVALGKDAPILVLRGYADGHLAASADAGAPAEAVRRAVEGVEYAARVVDASRWTAEWKIPLASLGVNPAEHRKLAFNLTVRKVGSSLWLMWEGTGGNSWWVERAGFLELEP